MGLLTTRQVANRLGISDRRIRQLLAEGRIESIRIGGRWLVEESDCHFERKPRGGYRPRKK
jgi:excisionase family DNA binding protein